MPDIDLKKVIAHQGDKDTFILNRQYQAITDLHREKLISELSLVTLTPAIDDFYRLQGALKRVKNYPYARNYYSIAVFLVIIYVGLVPLDFIPTLRIWANRPGPNI